MKLGVGLGNPGEKYQHNRHNAGFMVLDKFVDQAVGRKWEVDNKFEAEIIRTKDCILVKPLSYMNDSGRVVAAIARFYKVKYTELYVVHDDLDIPLGQYKIQHAKGPRVHYGVNSIEEQLGTEDFWRVRVGVENREIKGNKGVAGEVYSLQNFREDEEAVVKRVVGEVVAELMSRLI